MPLYIDETKYPHDYDWLSADKQQAIIDYLNDLSESRTRTFALGRSSIAKKPEHKAFIERQWQKYCDKEDGALDLLDALGIKVEHDWVGHRGNFLATYNDALAQQEYYDDIAHDAEGDVDEYRIGRNEDSDYDY